MKYFWIRPKTRWSALGLYSSTEFYSIQDFWNKKPLNILLPDLIAFSADNPLYFQIQFKENHSVTDIKIMKKHIGVHFDLDPRLIELSKPIEARSAVSFIFNFYKFSLLGPISLYFISLALFTFSFLALVPSMQENNSSFTFVPYLLLIIILFNLSPFAIVAVWHKFFLRKIKVTIFRQHIKVQCVTTLLIGLGVSYATLDYIVSDPNISKAWDYYLQQGRLPSSQGLSHPPQ